MTKSALAVGLTVAALVTASSPSARAEGNDDARAEARALGERGDAQFGAGRCDLAIPLWRRAEARFHAPTLLLRIARCQSLTGHVVDAVATLEVLLAEPLAADAPPAFHLARAEAKRDLAAVRGRVATLFIAVDAREQPAGTSLEIDGQPVPPRRVSFPVDPGSHVVRLRLGEAVWEQPVVLGDGEERLCTVSLSAEVSPAPPRTQRRVGLGLGATGLASLATGFGLALSALGGYRDLAARGAPSLSSLRARAVAADATLGLGTALAAASIVLLVTEPKAPAAPPLRVRFAAGLLGVVVSGEL